MRAFVLLVGVPLLAQGPARFQLLPQPVPSQLAAFAIAGDFDGDGHQDLLVPGDHGGGPALLARGNGSGTFADAVPFGTFPASPTQPVRATAVGDLDGDGRDDLVAAVGFGWELLLSRPQGLVAQPLPVALPGPCQLFYPQILPVIGDVDGDGRADLLLAHHQCSGTWLLPQAAPPRLLRGLGGGAFQELALPAITVAAVAAWIADVDGDGDRDLVFVQGSQVGTASHAFRAVVLRQDPGSQFVPVGSLPVTSASLPVEQATLGDLDGDGLPDLTALISGSLTLLPNLGGAAFGITPGATHLETVVRLAAGDTDGDGRQEVLLARHRYGFEVWEWRQGALALRARHGRSVDNPRDAPAASQLLVVDLDADADLDVMVQGTWQPQLWYGDGVGGFDLVTTVPDATTPPPLQWFDFDGDGWLDQLVASRLGVFLSRNDGAGRMVPDAGVRTPPLPAVAASGGRVQPFDYDLDGDLDLLVVSGSTGADTNLILVNDGTGGFTVALTFPGTNDVVRTMVLDVDADGDDDVVLVRRSAIGEPAVLLRGDGNGGWQLQQFVYQPGLYDLLPCDLDRDGAVDFLVQGVNGPTRVLHNDGAGGFAIDPAFPDIRAWTSAVVDLDGDGDSDFVLDGTVVWNHGGSYAVAPLPTTAPLWHLRVLGAFDVDRDGRPDLVHRHGVDVIVFAQQVGGAFVERERQAMPLLSGAVSVADIDRDGDPDLLTSVACWFDVSHQLTRRGPPRVGRTSVKVAIAAPGTWLALAAAFGRIDRPAPPFGQLYLDPLTTVVVGIGAVHPSGLLEVPLAVPNLPQLIGVPLYWQAAFLDGPWLSGLEPSVIGAR